MPELQGIIGSVYASAIKLPNEVSTAIKEQYSPLGPSDKSNRILIIPKQDLLSPKGSLEPVAFISIAIKPTKLSNLSENDNTAASAIEGEKCKKNKISIKIKESELIFI